MLYDVGSENEGGGSSFFSIPGCLLSAGMLGIVAAIAIPNLIEARG